MPVKHVRFSRSNQYQSPPPSLTHSLSTLPSTDGPETPPPLPGPTPYPFPLPPAPRTHYAPDARQLPDSRQFPDSHQLPDSRQLPPPHRQHTSPPRLQHVPAPYPQYVKRPPPQVRLHALIALAQTAPINWDMTLPPSSISTSHHELSVHDLSEPATNPPFPSIKIISPHLRWAFIVHAGRSGFVSVSDILAGLHRALQVNVTPDEFRSLPSQQDSRRVTRAYESRYRRVRDPRAYAHEKMQGVKRVDFLMGRTRFLGFSRTPQGPDILLLNFS